MRAIFAALRPRQWTKNGFVLVAPLFSRRILELAVAERAAAAFVLFCLAASGIYVLNDIADRERDRLHPEKRNRPIASGALSVSTAVVVAVVLLLLALSGAFLLGIVVGGLLAGYVAIQLAYSTVLRNVVIIDVFCIASGFVLRVLIGAFAVDVFLSSWLILTTIFVSLFLGLCKRRAEYAALATGSSGHRATLTEYEPEFLDQLIAVTTASVVICYSLYTTSARTIAEFGTRNLVVTVPFVIYGIFRYLFLVHRREGGGSPATAFLSDPWLFGNFLAWAATTMAILYVR